MSCLDTIYARFELRKTHRRTGDHRRRAPDQDARWPRADSHICSSPAAPIGVARDGYRIPPNSPSLARPISETASTRAMPSTTSGASARSAGMRDR